MGQIVDGALGMGFGAFSSVIMIASAALVIGGALTAPLSAYLSHRLPARTAGLAIGLLLMGLNLWVLIRALS